MSWFVSKIVLLSFFSLFFFQPVQAYIYPGTGSFIIQLLIAGFLGGLYALKVFWKQVIGFFVSIFSWFGKK